MWRTGLRRPQAVWRGKSGAFCIFCVRCRYVIDACRCSIALGSQIKEKYFIPTQGNCSNAYKYFSPCWIQHSLLQFDNLTYLNNQYRPPKWNIACLLFLLESNWSPNFQPSIFWCYLSSGQASKLIQIDGCPSSLAELFSFYFQQRCIVSEMSSSWKLKRGSRLLKKGARFKRTIFPHLNPSIGPMDPTAAAGACTSWRFVGCHAPTRHICRRRLWKNHDVSMGNIHPKRWRLLPFSYHHYCIMYMYSKCWVAIPFIRTHYGNFTTKKCPRKTWLTLHQFRLVQIYIYINIYF